MHFKELALSGAYLIDIDPKPDDRGFFARTFCEDEFIHAGLVHRYPQASISFNAKRGTVRGMHFQVSPHGETKLVRCISGAVYDVIVDLRPNSATYLSWIGVELTDQNRSAIYIPEGFAHGFQTLEDRSELLYMIDVPHVAGASAGIRWDDPGARVAWPEPVTVISDRDRTFPDLQS